MSESGKHAAGHVWRHITHRLTYTRRHTHAHAHRFSNPKKALHTFDRCSSSCSYSNIYVYWPSISSFHLIFLNSLKLLQDQFGGCNRSRPQIVGCARCCVCGWRRGTGRSARLGSARCREQETVQGAESRSAPSSFRLLTMNATSAENQISNNDWLRSRLV